MGLVLPVLDPQTVGVGAGNGYGGDDDVDGELAPEVCVGRRGTRLVRGLG